MHTGLSENPVVEKQTNVYFKTLLNEEKFDDLKLVLEDLKEKHDFRPQERAEIWAYNFFYDIKEDILKIYNYMKRKEWQNDIIFNKMGKVEYLMHLMQ